MEKSLKYGEAITKNNVTSACITATTQDLQMFCRTKKKTNLKSKHANIEQVFVCSFVTH